MDRHIIKCPECGWEYLPCEIYFPNYFLGKNKNILKTEDGEIDEVYGGIDQDLTETYSCDHCGKDFKVTATLDFTTELDQEANFNEDFIAELFEDRLFLSEE